MKIGSSDTAAHKSGRRIDIGTTFPFLSKSLRIFLVLFVIVIATASLHAQSCPTQGTGSHTISADISNTSTGLGIAEGGVFPVGATFRIDGLATTGGGCETACTYYPNDVNHIAISADISTTGGLNGTYTVGSVFGRNPDGTTAFLTTLDSRSADSTGPILISASAPGTYTFHIQGIIDR